MDLQQATEEFAAQGFVAWRGFMHAAEIAQVNAELDRYIAEVLPTLTDNPGFYEDKDDPATLVRLQSMADHDDDFHQLFHRVVRVLHDARGQEQALDVIAPVEGQREIDDFLYRERRAADVGGRPVDAEYRGPFYWS